MAKESRLEALRQSDRLFRLLVQGLTDHAIFMLDSDGHVRNWNSGAQHIKGYTAEEIIGQHFSRFYTAEDLETDEPRRALETALSTGRYEKEGWRVRKDESRFWASVVMEPIRDDAGAHIGFAKVIRDITERKDAERGSTTLPSTMPSRGCPTAAHSPGRSKCSRPRGRTPATRCLRCTTSTASRATTTPSGIRRETRCSLASGVPCSRRSAPTAVAIASAATSSAW